MVGEKKALLLAFSVMFVLASCNVQEAPEPTETPEPAGTVVKLVPVSEEVAVGDELVVRVMVDNVENLYAYQLTLSFDNNVLEFQDAKQSGFLKGDENIFAITPSVTAGTVKNIGATRVGDIPGVSGVGVLAEVTFKAIAQGESAIGVESLTLIDSATEAMDFTTESGKVEVR